MGKATNPDAATTSIFYATTSQSMPVKAKSDHRLGVCEPP